MPPAAEATPTLEKCAEAIRALISLLDYRQGTYPAGMNANEAEFAIRQFLQETWPSTDFGWPDS